MPPQKQAVSPYHSKSLGVCVVNADLLVCWIGFFVNLMKVGVLWEKGASVSLAHRQVCENISWLVWGCPAHCGSIIPEQVVWSSIKTNWASRPWRAKPEAAFLYSLCSSSYFQAPASGSIIPS